MYLCIKRSDCHGYARHHSCGGHGKGALPPERAAGGLETRGERGWVEGGTAVGAAAGSSTTEVFSKCVLEMGAEQGAKEISMGSLLKFSDEQGCSRQTKAKTPIR